MEFIKPIIIAASPVVIASITQFIKETTIFDAMNDSIRSALLQMITAGLSLLSALTAYLATGTFDANTAQAFLVAGILFLATSVPFWFGKKKKTVV